MADFPYTFFLLDPSIIICRGFAFNQNGNTVSGVYAQFSVLANGDCGSVSSNLYTMSGIRMSALLSSTQPAIDPQDLLEQLEARALPQSAVAKPNFSPLIQRAIALLRQ